MQFLLIILQFKELFIKKCIQIDLLSSYQYDAILKTSSETNGNVTFSL